MHSGRVSMFSCRIASDAAARIQATACDWRFGTKRWPLAPTCP